MNNEFWTFSLACYGQPGVAKACLAAQDERGLDVNIILYGAWLASMGKTLSAGHLAGLEALLQPWQRQVVAPLRAQRRALKDYAEAADFRESLKSLELEAEHRQQDLMWSYYQGADEVAGSADALRENLALLWQGEHGGCPLFTALLEEIGLAQAYCRAGNNG